MHRKRKPKLGQNFLVDDRARFAIVDALGDIRDRIVLEIGPGHGAITEILAERCRRLVAIELDPPLAAELRFRFRNHAHVEILERDVLDLDLAELVPAGETADLVGNLPYYITTEILLRIFAAGVRGTLARAVVMMQREVAERVAANPGTREFGLLSATAQMNARVQDLFTLPPEAFSPPPDVHSTVLRLEMAPRFGEFDVDPARFERLLRASFAQKRKTLLNNLRSAGYAPEDLARVWPRNIAPKARAEAISLEAMAEMYHALKQVSPPESQPV